MSRGGRRKSLGSFAARVRRIRLLAFDFDGVFTDNLVQVFQDGTEAVTCFRGDGIGLRKIQDLGIQTAVISTESNPVVTARSRKLGVRCIQNCPDKRLVVQSLAQELGISLEEVAFVGNDVNDLPCLECVGVPIVVRDAHPDVIRHAIYRTSAQGGRGAVREVCDLVARIWVRKSVGAST